MPNPVLHLEDVKQKAELFALPRIIAFNRLESRPRTRDFSRSLKAEVRDPLWMLTRQWQFGEFKGEDAASCITSRIAYEHTPIDRVRLGGDQIFEYDPLEIPLETRIEREQLPLWIRKTTDGKIYSDLIRTVKWGRQFQKMMVAAGLQTHLDTYLEAFPIRVFPEPPVSTGGTTETERTIEDLEAEQIHQSVAGRVVDGIAIFVSVTQGKHDDWIDTQGGGDEEALKTVAADFADVCGKKLARVFSQPAAGEASAWLPNRLEYQFSVAGPPQTEGPQTVLFAEQYHHGRLDWYSFDALLKGSLVTEADAPTDTEMKMESFFPSNVRFKGQPMPRYWEMEESQTDFGKISTSATGILHLLLAEFGLIFSNDWFMLPHPMDINTVSDVHGIVVDDTFGRHTFIRPAARTKETSWQEWAQFDLSDDRGLFPSASRFYLVPSVGKVLESDPLEKVNFLRDEMANMVWAVEAIVPSQTGRGISGYEVTRGIEEETDTTPAPAGSDAKIRYRLGTIVPGNWVPFIPVHEENGQTEIRLQRARMAGGKPPRGQLLREPGSPYFVEEEEVPRSGIYVERSWRRARWIGGKTFTWVGRRKTAGSGEGYAELIWDQIVDLPSSDTDT